MTFYVGEPVTNSRSHDPSHVGVIVKVIRAQGKYKAVCVVDFGGSYPETVWQRHLRKVQA